MVKEMSQPTLMPCKFYDPCLNLAFMENVSLYMVPFKRLYSPTTRFISVLSGVRIPAPPPTFCYKYCFTLSQTFSTVIILLYEFPESWLCLIFIKLPDIIEYKLLLISSGPQ